MSGFWETLTDAFEEARSDLTDSRTVEEAARLEAGWESENENSIWNAKVRRDWITGGTTVSGGLKVNF
jgi:hypothetical protein